MLRFCDGFDSYLATADLAQKWARHQHDHHRLVWLDFGAWQWAATEGVNGGGCIKHSGVAGESISRDMRRNGNYDFNRYVRDMLWFKIAIPPASQLPFLSWLEEETYSSDGWQPDVWDRINLEIDTNGFLVQRTFGDYRSTAPTPPVTLYAGNTNVCDNQWHCIERYFYLAGTTNGELRIALDGVDLINDPDANTMNSDFGAASGYVSLFSILSLGVDTWIDDVIIWDDAGLTLTTYPDGTEMDTLADEHDWDPWTFDKAGINSDINNFPERGQDGFNGYLGPKQITTIRPAGLGTINNFDEVVGAATRYEAVNGVIRDESSYLRDSTLGAREVFDFEAFPHDLPIKAVALNFQARMEDHGSVVFQPEALQSPDFALGFRRRLLGKYKVSFDYATSNLVSNAGPDFVDTTGWSAGNGGVLSVEEGNLKLEHTTGTSPGAVAYFPITVVPGTRYRLRVRGSKQADNRAWQFLISRNTAGTDNISGGVLVGTNAAASVPYREKTVFIPPNEGTTLYVVFRYNSVSLLGFVLLDFVELYEETGAYEYKLYQWAMSQDPNTLTPWTQAGIDSAQFGMRITT